MDMIAKSVMHYCIMANGSTLPTRTGNLQMHDYNAKDLATCLQNRKLVFIGDSSTRQIFWTTGKKLGLHDEGREKHTTFSIGAKGVSIEFIWDPYLNATHRHRELTAASIYMDGVSTVGTTAALLIGGGLWHDHYLEEASFLEWFKHSIDAISESTSFQGAKNSGGTLRRYSFGPLNEGSLVPKPLRL